MPRKLPARCPDAAPCPFCGCAVISLKVRATVILECYECGALIIRKSEREALAAWNRRQDFVPHGFVADGPHGLFRQGPAAAGPPRAWKQVYVRALPERDDDPVHPDAD